MKQVLISFDQPAWLALLVLLPLVWLVGRHSLAALGRWRRWLALALRTVVVVLLVLAAAEIQWVQKTTRLTVIYLLDQSLSIPLDRRQAMIEYVNAATRRHRKADDRAGVIAFGREALVEAAPVEHELRLETRIEGLLDPEYTHLAGAVKLALASFPEDTAKRIVLVSDGNENLGDVLAQARLATQAGVGIDVVPVIYHAQGEVAVDKLVVPNDVRQGAPFDLRVVLDNQTPTPAAGANAQPPEVVRGRLIITQRTDDQPIVLSDQPVEVPPGKRIFTIRQTIEQPNFYSYEARFVPDVPQQDRLLQNNHASAFTHVRGSGQVLLIEDYEHRGEHAQLIERLRTANLEVTVRSSDQLFSTLAELQPFDTILLANVPREHFSDAQIEMLAHNTHDLGSGLIMLGGPSSFGAGGWAETDVEAAMPVDFEIKNAKVAPAGALMLVMDCSGSMDGDKIDMSRVAAIAAVRVLGERDQVGVITFDSNYKVLVPMQVVGARDRIIRSISRLSAGGGTDMKPAMIEGYRQLTRAKSAMKHMIVLTDGQTPGSDFDKLAAEHLKQGITTTSVAVGGDTNQQLLQSIALAGGGKLYVVHDARGIPRIFMKEARRVARPMMYENEAGFTPAVQTPLSLLSGVSDPLPPLTGYVMTTVKNSPLVEVGLRSPEPGIPENSTILATWTYGLGKTVAFTTDAGARWAKSWGDWSNYDKLFTQMVRWSLRPIDDAGQLQVATDVSDGRVNVVVTALDAKEEFVNFLNVRGTVIAPTMQSQPLALQQVAPGRYVGSFPAADAGNYFLALNSGVNRGGVRVGVNVPYSPEFRDREANDALLAQLAALPARDGQPGALIHDPTGQGNIESLLAVDLFRHDLSQTTRSQDVWPNCLWLAGLVFFADVLGRRVQLSLAWAPRLARQLRERLFPRASVETAAPHLERLRSRKQAVAQTWSQKQTTYEPPPSVSGAVDVPTATSSDIATPAPQSPPVAPSLAPDSPPAESDYTSRLLKAKKKVWEERK